ncbi:hypothetical protein ES703_93259 [subsurface metagenome]
MGRRIPVEEKIKRLREKRNVIIEQKAEAFRKRFTATYDAKIDVLEKFGLKETATERKKVGGRTIDQMMEKMKERYIFFWTKFYEHMGMDPQQARARAEEIYAKYRLKWKASLTA